MASGEIDKSWMFESDILGKVYRDGVKFFIQFASNNGFADRLCPCPCVKCGNADRMDIKLVKCHLETKGVDKTYTTWFFHGERKPINNVVSTPAVENVVNEQVIEDEFGFPDLGPFIDAAFDLNGRVDGDADDEELIDDDPDVQRRHEKYKKLAEQKLYPTCEGNVSTLSAIVELHNIKKQFGISGNCVTKLLEMIKGWLPEENTLPKKYPAMKSVLKELGMKYKAIHACPNHCFLYYKENEDKSSCPVCHTSRYLSKEGKFGTKESKEPALVLRYFNLEERLRRFYGTPWIAEAMTWHHRAIVSKEHMRHPIDSPLWASVKRTFPRFAEEGRNVWLGISTDGFNPHGVQEEEAKGVKANPGRGDAWMKGHLDKNGKVIDSAVETFKKVKAATEKRKALVDAGLATAVDFENDELAEVFGPDNSKTGLRGYSSHVSKKQAIHASLASAVRAANTNQTENLPRSDSINETQLIMQTQLITNIVLQTMATQYLREPFINPVQGVEIPEEVYVEETQPGTTVLLCNKDGETVATGYIVTGIAGEKCHNVKVYAEERKICLETIEDGDCLLPERPQADGRNYLGDFVSGEWLVWPLSRLQSVKI